MKVIKYSYAGCPTIEAFSNDDSFIRGLMGPFRSGKSSGCVTEIVARSLAQEPGPDGIRRTRWLVVRNTFSQLQDTTIKTFHQWLPPHLFGKYVDRNHTYTITAFENCEIEVLFRALDRPDHVSNLLSLEVTGAWINEAREIPWAIVEAIQGRVGQYPPKREGGPTWWGLFMDTNPPDVDSEWYKFFELREHKNARLFKQPSGLSDAAENVPNLVAGRGYYENLAEGKDEEWVKVYIHGEYGFVIDGKPVYPEYSDDFHCAKEDPKVPGSYPLAVTIEAAPVYRGWDFGLTPACVFCQVQPGGRLVAVDELIATSMGIDRFSDEVLAHSSQYYPGREFIDIGDPAGLQKSQTDEKTCFQIMGAKKINIEAGLQSQVIRKESLRKPLRTVDKGKPMFVIHPRCQLLRKALMGGYQYRRLQVSGERYDDKPKKDQYSHCFPAGTLVSVDGTYCPIELVIPGSWVQTPAGMRRVTAAMNSVVTQLVEVQTNDGRRIHCTPDHPIAVPGGYCRADALQYADSIIVEEVAWDDREFTRFKSSMGFAIIESPAGITKPTIGSAANICIGQSGAITMGRSQTDTISTTLTKIAATMKSAICKHCRAVSILDTTCRCDIRGILMGAARYWTGFVRWLRLGRGALRAALFTEKMALGKRLALPLLGTLAFDAAGNTRLSLGSVNVAFAATPVNQPNAGMPDSIMKREPVWSVANHFGPTVMPKQRPVASVVAVRAVPLRSPIRVYDLTVDDQHCFYANGILVSNCVEALEYVCTRLYGEGLTSQTTGKEEPVDDRYYAEDRSPIGGY